MPEMHYVQSSNIEQVGYDEDNNELHIKFKGSTIVYVYLGVQKYHFDDLLNAVSVGSYFNREIKDAYSFEKR